MMAKIEVPIQVNIPVEALIEYLKKDGTLVEVVHGEWIAVHDWLQIPQEERGTYRCSACGQVMKYPWNYCPHCGAKMDGEVKER